MSCSCEDWYDIVNWICEKSDFQKLDDAIVKYINDDKYLSNSIWFRYYLDKEQINKTEWIILFVDTSVKWWSQPREITTKYSDEWTCPNQVEWITSAVWQWYIIAFEKIWNEYIINDFFEIPSFHPYIDEYYNALSYPVLNTKFNNYLSYDWGKKPTSEKDKELLEYTKIINFKDIDGDWKKLEFFIMNYADQVCWTYNYLLVWYDEANKTIKQYFFWKV